MDEVSAVKNENVINKCWQTQCHLYQISHLTKCKIHWIVWVCLVGLTFTFAASALGSVGHCSGVRASIQNQQLLRHSVVIAARAAHQRGVWRYRREDRGMIFTVMGGQCNDYRTAGERKGEKWVKEGGGNQRSSSRDILLTICNLLKISISSWWHNHSIAIGNNHKSRDQLSTATTEKDK